MKLALRIIVKMLIAANSAIEETQYERIDESVLNMRSRNAKLTEVMNLIRAAVRILNDVLEGD